METPLQKMSRLLPGLKGANRRLAEWYLSMAEKQMDIPVNYDSSDVAQAVDVSRATVMRFARKLGYAGFPEFRQALMESRILLQSERAQAAISDLSDPLTTVFQTQLQALTLSMQTIDREAFDKAAQWLADAPDIMWLGWGDSYFPAASAEHKCHIGGMPARSFDRVQDIGLHLDMLPPASVVVVVSHSGQWRALAEPLAAFRKRGGRVISVVGRHDVLAEVADVAFITTNPTFGVGTRVVTWRPSQHVLLDALVFEATRRKGRQPVAWPP